MRGPQLPPESWRVDTHGVIERGERVIVVVDGEPLEAYLGETLATVMLAYGRRVFRQTARYGQPRGIYCGMGVCYECLMVVNGRPNVRACMTPVVDGLRAETQRGPGEGVSPVPNWE